jgi:hypothetical protein
MLTGALLHLTFMHSFCCERLKGEQAFNIVCLLCAGRRRTPIIVDRPVMDGALTMQCSTVLLMSKSHCFVPPILLARFLMPGPWFGKAGKLFICSYYYTNLGENSYKYTNHKKLLYI